MVTLSNPTLKRLLEVNPAPDDFELPPISDVALFESILERARSEELSFRPVRVRSWRPGVVVAAAAFVVVLAIAGAIGLLSGMLAEHESPFATEPPVVTTVAPAPTVTTVAPAPTTVPPTVTTVAPVPTTVPRYEVTISDLDDGLFSASGSAVDEGLMCSKGTIDSVTIVSRQAFTSGGDHSEATEERTLTCAGGSGSIVFGMWVYQSQLMAGYSFYGKWIVVSGTGDHERVAGGGDLDGSCGPDRSNCSFEYTGHLDHSRDFGTATTIAAPSGWYDVEITYEGGFTNGPFAATGPAVEAGLFCPDGMLARTCSEIGLGNSIRRCDDTFFCADGTGWVTIGSDASTSIVESPTIRSRGPWTVLGGSATYESITGSGTISMISYDDGKSNAYTFAGQVAFSD